MESNMEPTQTTAQTTPPVQQAPEPKTSYGALIGLLVVVAVVVTGALYFLNQRVDKNVYIEDSRVETITEQSDSTDPALIEADLKAQTAEDFDKEIDAAFVELEAAFQE